MVLDVKDSFYTPVHLASGAPVLRWQVTRHYYICNKLALAWCRFLALVVRLELAMFAKDEARAEIYVDDPVITLMGSPAARRCVQATFDLVWTALNLQLSYAKGQGQLRDGKLLGSVV